MKLEKKSVLDERELQDLYRIEHRGLWLVYALLCAAVVVQLIMGAPFSQMAGELFVVGVSSVALIAAYARYGIWDDRSRPSAAGNATCAAASCVGVALVVLARSRNAAAALAAGLMTFALCFLLLTAMMACVQRGQRRRERELEDD